MTLAELIAEYRRDENDIRLPYLWSDEDLTAWFNEAENEAAIRAGLLFDVIEVPLVIDATAVTLDPAIHEVLRVDLRDASGATHKLWLSDRLEQDRLNGSWRELSGLPNAAIVDDKEIVFNRIADADYTVVIEAFKRPAAAMSADDDEPEIAALHHSRLADWVRYKAYSIPDTDFLNLRKSERSFEMFEEYFGRRPTSKQTARTNANRPHRIKCW